jgi:hypothetical protein
VQNQQNRNPKKHPRFRDNWIILKKELVIVLMSRMVVGGGVSTNKDCDERLLVSFLMSRMVEDGGASTNRDCDSL